MWNDRQEDRESDIRTWVGGIGISSLLQVAVIADRDLKTS